MRRAVVGELTAAGLSIRAIAPVVGVSKSQVAEDVHQVSSAGHLHPRGDELAERDPALHAQVGPDAVLKTYREALAVYWQRNAEATRKRESAARAAAKGARDRR